MSVFHARRVAAPSHNRHREDIPAQIDWKNISCRLADAQFLTARRFQPEDCARLFSVPVQDVEVPSASVESIPQ